MRVAHRSQPCPSQLTQGTHHVKNHACLARLIEMQVVPHYDVEKIVRRERPIRRRLDMIAGNKKLLLPIGRSEDRRLRVIGAVGKKLQSQKRMSSAAFSQVNLDGIRLPFSIRTYYHEI